MNKIRGHEKPRRKYSERDSRQKRARFFVGPIKIIHPWFPAWDTYSSGCFPSYAGNSIFWEWHPFLVSSVQTAPQVHIQYVTCVGSRFLTCNQLTFSHQRSSPCKSRQNNWFISMIDCWRAIDTNISSSLRIASLFLAVIENSSVTTTEPTW